MNKSAIKNCIKKRITYIYLRTIKYRPMGNNELIKMANTVSKEFGFTVPNIAIDSGSFLFDLEEITT